MPTKTKTNRKLKKNLHPQFCGKLPVLNEDSLERMGACDTQVSLFNKMFKGRGVKITHKRLLKVAETELEIDWLCRELLNGVAYLEYESRCSSFTTQRRRRMREARRQLEIDFGYCSDEYNERSDELYQAYQVETNVMRGEVTLHLLGLITKKQMTHKA